MASKRQHIRVLLVLALSLFASIFVAACGGDDDENGNGEVAGEELTPVDFQLSWLPAGDNLAFWVGDAMGFYEEEGIDLNIRHANDPTVSIRLVATGERPMGIAYTGDIIFSEAQGSTVKSVYALTETSPFGIISLEDAEIEAAEDLRDKRVGVTTLPVDRAFFNTMLDTAGVPRDEVDVVDPGQAGIQQVIQGNLDGTSAIINYEPAVLEAEGIDDYNYVFYADYGAPDPPFFCIVVNPEWLEDNENVVAAFVRATQRSFEWTTENIDEAGEIFVEEFPNEDPELAQEIWMRQMEIAEDGTNDPEKWQELADFFEAEGLIEEPVDVEELFTNEFL
jgi:ABC-type nitrate/sulfonate/bicarbonate transport system substrate-binding protein